MVNITQYINRFWIWLLRATPMLICFFLYMSSGRDVHSGIGLGICIISSIVYFLGVVFKTKSKTYSISEGALLLVMLQLSIIFYVIINYFGIENLIVDYRVIIVSLLLVLLLIAVFKAFVIIPKYSDDICCSAPNVNISELTSESKKILSKIDDIDNKEQEIILYSSICILRDYLFVVSNCPIMSHPHELLSNYMPNQQQIVNYPFESLALLLSAQNYIENNYAEDKYCNFQTNMQIIDERLSKYK